MQKFGTAEKSPNGIIDSFSHELRLLTVAQKFIGNLLGYISP